MEPENDGLEDDFPDFNWVNFRFHVNLPGCTLLETNISHRKGSLENHRLKMPFWEGIC